MRVKVQLQRRLGRSGTLEWDSDTGELGGTLANEVACALDEAKTRGSVEWAAAIPSSLTYPIRDPRHAPAEFAVILGSMGFTLPPELAAAYPVPSDEQLGYDEIDAMTPEERSRLEF